MRATRHGLWSRRTIRGMSEPVASEPPQRRRPRRRRLLAWLGGALAAFIVIGAIGSALDPAEPEAESQSGSPGSDAASGDPDAERAAVLERRAQIDAERAAEQEAEEAQEAERRAERERAAEAQEAERAAEDADRAEAREAFAQDAEYAVAQNFGGFETFEDACDWNASEIAWVCYVDRIESPSAGSLVSYLQTDDPIQIDRAARGVMTFAGMEQPDLTSSQAFGVSGELVTVRRDEIPILVD